MRIWPHFGSALAEARGKAESQLHSDVEYRRRFDSTLNSTSWNFEDESAADTMTPEYKDAKIASVSFLGGGGIWEINCVTLVAPVRLTCYQILSGGC